jgi:CheY-like chemotaxis protein
LPLVFELFTQLQGSLSRSEGGLGIGLMLARRLAELHGGTIQVLSEGVGKGSEFIVRLPRLHQSVLPVNAETTPQARLDVPARRILVVDDNQDAAETLAMLLRITGHEVRSVYNGPAALEAARTQPPEVVLCDLGLPHMDGLEVARRLRRDLGLTNALLVALTGYGKEEDRRRSQEAGFNAHLVKPVNLDALNELLSRSVSLVAGEDA